ncbi:hypothetical protein RFI_00374, partial [Reticulomyxa filosa]
QKQQPQQQQKQQPQKQQAQQQKQPQQKQQKQAAPGDIAGVDADEIERQRAIWEHIQQQNNRSPRSEQNVGAQPAPQVQLEEAPILSELGLSPEQQMQVLAQQQKIFSQIRQQENERKVQEEAEKLAKQLQQQVNSQNAQPFSVAVDPNQNKFEVNAPPPAFGGLPPINYEEEAPPPAFGGLPPVNDDDPAPPAAFDGLIIGGPLPQPPDDDNI